MPEGKKAPLFWGLIALCAAALAFYHLSHILLPFLLSFALAYIVSPLVMLLRARGIRRQVVVIALYLAVLAGIALLADTAVTFAAGQLQQLQAQGPEYMARARAFLETMLASVNARLPGGLRVHAIDARDLQSSIMSQAENLPRYLMGMFPVVSLLFLIPFITFFMLIDGESSLDGLIQRCPSRYVEQMLHLLSEIDASLGNYLRGLILVAAAIFCASFVGLVIMGVDQALTISIVAAVSSFIPYAGAVAGAVVGGLLAGFQFGTAAAGLKVVALFVAIRFGDEIFLQPFIAKHSVHLHPLVFLLALMIGGEVFGFAGLVFAIPVLCVLKALARVAWAWYMSEAREGSSEIIDAAPIPYT